MSSRSIHSIRPGAERKVGGLFLLVELTKY